MNHLNESTSTPGRLNAAKDDPFAEGTAPAQGPRYPGESEHRLP